MKIKNFAVFVFALLLICMLFINSDTAVSSVKNSLFFCYNTVIPSLFIFMVLAAFLSKSKMSTAAAMPFYPIFRLMNIKNKTCIAYAVLGILGGFASGAYFLGLINQNGENKNLSRILSVMLCSNSPSFIIIAVGSQMLGNINTGIILYTAYIVSAVCTAFILSFPVKPETCTIQINNQESSLLSAVKSACDSIINICAVIVFVCCVRDVINIYIDSKLICAVLFCFTEVTASCSYITENFSANIYLISFALCVFPLSAAMQMKSMCNIDVKFVFISKLIHIPINFLFLRILLNLFPQTVSVFSNRSDIIPRMFWNNPKISLWFLFAMLFFVYSFDKKIGVFTILKK